MNNSITIYEKYGLTTNGLQYSEQINALVSQGYTSSANNTYFNAFRLADGILIKEDVGIGYCRTFLNGIKIYTLKDRQLIADQRYSCVYYSKDELNWRVQKLLLEKLTESARVEGLTLNIEQAKQIISQVVNKALYGDQLQEFQQANRMLSE